MIDNPEIPEPERAPSAEDKPVDAPAGQPHLNGNGGDTQPVYDNDQFNEKLIAWMKATDKELKLLKINQLILAGAVLFVLVTTAKNIRGAANVLP